MSNTIIEVSVSHQKAPEADEKSVTVTQKPSTQALLLVRLLVGISLVVGLILIVTA